MTESRCLCSSVAWEFLFLKGFFFFSLNLEDFWSCMAEKQLAGLDCFPSALLPAARYNPKPFPCQQLFLLAVLVSMPRKHRSLSFSFQQWNKLVGNNQCQPIRLSGVAHFPSHFSFPFPFLSFLTIFEHGEPFRSSLILLNCS